LTIDPRDTPEFLNGYLPDDRDRVTIIPANQREIARLARELGYRFGVSTLDGETIHHQDAVYLFDRAGRLRLMYPYRYLDPRKLQADLLRLQTNAQAAHGDVATDTLTADYWRWPRPRHNW
jgi:cytochrome oxidase Cu insertion factor (SCO1/SenC/PrrC family)